MFGAGCPLGSLRLLAGVGLDAMLKTRLKRRKDRPQVCGPIDEITLKRTEALTAVPGPGLQ